MTDDLTKRYKDKDMASSQDWKLRDMADKLGMSSDEVMRVKDILETSSAKDIENYIRKNKR